ncbi:hypothetical protein Tco_1093291 [Tanacetum coccineum]|uniref:Uncharacterized protein n=1 Tax=Tanacetum coccineum TaxID=301880 RepID=A0ABQ5IC96_9ASTR
MSWFLRCSWCGGPFNGGNYQRCTNMSFGEEFVRNPDPISYDETLDFSYLPPQPQTYSCELCGNDSYYDYDCPPRVPLCQPRNQNFYEPNLCYNSNSSGFDQPPQFSIDHQPQEDLNQQRMNDVHNEWIKSHNDMIESRNELLKTMQSLGEMLRQREHAANLSTHTPEPSRRFNSICYDDDDDDESTIPLNEIISQIPPSIAITPNDDSLPEKDVQEENFKIYSNPLFEFDEEYISSDINPLYNEVLEDIDHENSLLAIDEPFLLDTPPSGSKLVILEEVESS